MKRAGSISADFVHLFGRVGDGAVAVQHHSGKLGSFAGAEFVQRDEGLFQQIEKRLLK